MSCYSEKPTYKPTYLQTIEEGLEYYRPGGYHPVIVGDTFKDGRYTVYNKLGRGGFSTVWLAHDNEQNRLVALKIIMAEVTDPVEIRNLQYLNERCEGQLGSHCIIQIFDSFQHQGPNGSHHCLVTEICGSSLESLLIWHQEDSDSDSESYQKCFGIMKSSIILEQLMKAMAFVHDAGMCHGDINMANIVVYFGEPQSGCDNKDILGIYGEPRSQPVERLDGEPLGEGVPSQLYKSAHFPPHPHFAITEFRLIDFGQSFLKGEEPEKLTQPWFMRSPEGIFANTFDIRADVWSVGYIAYWLLAENHPFMSTDTTYGVVRRMLYFVEALPAEWEPKFEELRSKCEQAALTKNAYEHELWYRDSSYIDHVFSNIGPVMDLYASLIKGLMPFLPSDRLTIEEAWDLTSDIRMLCEEKFETGELEEVKEFESMIRYPGHSDEPDDGSETQHSKGLVEPRELDEDLETQPSRLSEAPQDNDHQTGELGHDSSAPVTDGSQQPQLSELQQPQAQASGVPLECQEKQENAQQMLPELEERSSQTNLKTLVSLPDLLDSHVPQQQQPEQRETPSGTEEPEPQAENMTPALPAIHEQNQGTTSQILKSPMQPQMEIAEQAPTLPDSLEQQQPILSALPWLADRPELEATKVLLETSNSQELIQLVSKAVKDEDLEKQQPEPEKKRKWLMVLFSQCLRPWKRLRRA